MGKLKLPAKAALDPPPSAPLVSHLPLDGRGGREDGGQGGGRGPHGGKFAKGGDRDDPLCAGEGPRDCGMGDSGAGDAHWDPALLRRAEGKLKVRLVAKACKVIRCLTCGAAASVFTIEP